MSKEFKLFFTFLIYKLLLKSFSTFSPDRSDSDAPPYIQVDYCCDRLHNYFTDRKFRNSGSSSHRSSRVKSWAEPTNNPTSTNVVSSSTGSRLDSNVEPAQLLPKPPEPPTFSHAPLTKQPSNPDNQMTSK